MTRIIELSQIGGPECLQERVINLPAPAAGEVWIDQSRDRGQFCRYLSSHRSGILSKKCHESLGVETRRKPVRKTGPPRDPVLPSDNKVA